MRKGALKIAAYSIFICLLITTFVYAATFAEFKDKIYTLASPNPHAIFKAPESAHGFEYMLVWVAVFRDSSFGSFKMAMIGYENEAGNHCEYHWYTDNLKAGEVFAYLTAKSWPSTRIDYDVTMANIIVNQSEHTLEATVIVKGKIVFSAKFEADTTCSLMSRLDYMELPDHLFRGVEATRPLKTVTVTGLIYGDFIGGRFDYIDAEMYDPSLLKGKTG